MEGVRVEDFVPCMSNLHGVAFINIKFHLPGEFPLGYRIKVILQKGGICWCFVRHGRGYNTHTLLDKHSRFPRWPVAPGIDLYTRKQYRNSGAHGGQRMT